MAKRKIVWSYNAQKKLYEILEFYNERNKSTSYSKKLYSSFQKELKLLLKYPNLGIKTDLDGIRGLIVGAYILYYEDKGDLIIIHSIWDSRQDPNKLLIK
jgi:plasmid stabilization system protein ParE